MSRFRNWLRGRITERSTIAGLVTLACTIGGFTLDVEQQASLVTLLSAIAGAFLVFTKESADAPAPGGDARDKRVR